jgi:hypothetical protein
MRFADDGPLVSPDVARPSGPCAGVDSTPFAITLEGPIDVTQIMVPNQTAVAVRRGRGPDYR